MLSGHASDAFVTQLSEWKRDQLLRNGIAVCDFAGVENATERDERG